MVELSQRWPATASNRQQPMSFDAVYAAHADFVWRCLQRLGTPSADLEDALQEVFMVAHVRLGDFDPNRALMTTWLFGICSNVARSMRRRHGRRSRSSESRPPEPPAPTPEEELQRAQTRERLLLILDALPAPLRATFVMFEVEGKSCTEISELCGVPLGTVHSRLHKARRRFRALFARQRRSRSRPSTRVMP